MTQYRVMKERLLNKFGPNSQKDAEETRRKIESLHGDHRGWDIYLAALVHDTSNNHIMQPVPIRPHQPVPPVTATQAQFVAYVINDANEQQAWDILPSHRHRHQRLSLARIGNLHFRTVFQPCPTISTKRPCEQDVGRTPHGHRHHHHEQDRRHIQRP